MKNRENQIKQAVQVTLEMYHSLIRIEQWEDQGATLNAFLIAWIETVPSEVRQTARAQFIDSVLNDRMDTEEVRRVLGIS